MLTSIIDLENRIIPPSTVFLFLIRLTTTRFFIMFPCDHEFVPGGNCRNLRKTDNFIGFLSGYLLLAYLLAFLNARCGTGVA